MRCTIQTFALEGISARPVRIEVDIHRGLPSFAIVGLPDEAVRETRERVRAALLNCGFDFPLTRIVVNVAPATVRRAAPTFDLAIVAALLGASGQVELPGRIALVGEVRLDGTVPAITGATPIAEAARDHGIDKLIVPAASAAEAALVAPDETVSLTSIAELRGFAMGDWPRRPTPARPVLDGPEGPDLADLRGLSELRRALEVAAAGRHGLLMAGPPGSGTTPAAVRIPSILPTMSEAEALEVARIASVADRISDGRFPAGRPFRAPHHTISEVGLAGGGIPSRPGEITFAHGGVLFLDQVDEFRRGVIEALRARLRDGEVIVSRGGETRRLPSRFLLVAAWDPSSLVHEPDDGQTDATRARMHRLTGRIGVVSDATDIRISVRPPSAADLAGPPGETSAAVRERVVGARPPAEARLGDGRANGDMSHAEIRHLRLDARATRLLAARRAAHPMSDRGADPVLRVARTIADLDGADAIGERHLEEAFSMR